MALENPLFQQANTVPARHMRGLVQALVDVEGVLPLLAGGLVVTQRAAGTNMSVDVAAGSCVVAGDDEANQGSYLCRSTAIENVAIAAAPGSNSRIDLIVARVRDATVTGTSSDWILDVIPGTVAASPVAPSTPNTAIPLAKVTVAAGTAAITNAMITDLRPIARNSNYLGTGGGTMTGELVVPDLSVVGLTGSVQPSRYVGQTTAGAPTTGAHLAGDWILDRTGRIYVCTVAGTPGTWTGVTAPDYQVFTASGTWTKPVGAKIVFVEMWGGGGAGQSAASAANGGGGGGGYRSAWILASALAATEMVTVGAGGAPGSSPGSGGYSMFQSVQATGGTGSSSNGVGGTGGGLLPGPQATSGPGADGIFAGGGGAAGSGYNGGRSNYGAGGGGAASSAGAGSGGTSERAGNGGAAIVTGTASPGQAPGGGGGGAYNGTGGAGARGEVRITTWI
jgi:hypothetical protein